MKRNFVLKIMMVVVVTVFAGSVSADPVCWWKFDETSGTEAVNEIGDPCGQLINGPVWSSGVLDGALFFDGSDDYVDLGNSTVLDNLATGDFTIAMWIKTTYTGRAILFGNYNGNPSYNFELGLSGAMRLYMDSEDHNASTVVNDGLWHHVAAVRDMGNNVYIYVDGELDYSNTSTKSAYSISNSTMIGRDPRPGSYYFNGIMDDVQVFDSALSESQVQALTGDYCFKCLYVDDDYTPAGYNDGHIWGVTAFSVIQDAINAADYGYTVNVAEGAYVENIVLKNGVAVIGADRDYTIIDGNATGTSAVRSNGCDPNTIIKSFTITNGTNNFHGGAMRNDNYSEIVIEDCLFTANSATSHGGAIYNERSTVSIINCEFTDNEAGNSGGAINDNTDSSSTIVGCVFANNSADGGGGAIIHYSNGNGTVTDCTFIENSAHVGGAMQLYNSSPTYTNCSFITNQATSHGGGVFNDVGTNPKMINCVFINNNAGENGGALGNFWSSLDLELTNCTFFGNTAAYGGCMYSRDCTVTINNCVSYGNSASIADDELSGFDSPVVTINYSNIAGCGGSGVAWNAGYGTDGGGNIDADPCFVDPAGADTIFGTTDDDLSLGQNSPCIDAADNDLVPAGINIDRAGDARFFDDITVTDSGNGTPPIVDMGAYERWIDICGDINHPYPKGDLNFDCIVNIGDLSVMSAHWLEDNRP